METRWVDLGQFFARHLIVEGHSMVYRDMYVIVSENEHEIAVNVSHHMNSEYYRPIGNRSRQITERVLHLFPEGHIVKISMLVFPDSPSLYV